jgi:hypothetical protein
MEIPDLKRQFDEIKAKIESKLALVASTAQHNSELLHQVERNEHRLNGLCIRYVFTFSPLSMVTSTIEFLRKNCWEKCCRFWMTP